MSSEAHITVTLSEELARFVSAEVKSGAYASGDDYVRELLQQHLLNHRAKAEKLSQLDAAFNKGLADSDAGRKIPLDEAFAKLRVGMSMCDLNADI